MDTLVLAAGTVFNQVVLWAVGDLEKQVEEVQYKDAIDIIHTFSGHKVLCWIFFFTFTCFVFVWFFVYCLIFHLPLSINLSINDVITPTGLNGLYMLFFSLSNKYKICMCVCFVFIATLTVLTQWLYSIFILLCPQGVIFSIKYHAQMQCMCSVSDDRSIQLWQLNFPSLDDRRNSALSMGFASNFPSIEDWHHATSILKHSLFGHTARVWDAVMMDTCFASIGEVCVFILLFF